MFHNTQLFQVPGETNTETGLAGKKSVETVKAVSLLSLFVIFM